MVLRPLRYQPPLRCSLRRGQAQSLFQRAFHASPRRRNEGMPDHYSTLDLQSNATPAEIKKQFYKLSKTHHPDRNPDDPQASERFVKVSEAYAVLGSADKRTRYDGDFLRAAAPAQRYPTGSYHSSSTPVGGRPPTGLSRRRTQFKGPPPSFFRNGGWGQQSEKRAESAARASHEGEHARASSSSSSSSSASQQDAHTAPPGMGPGGFAQGLDNDVPHFDRDGHFRTQDAVERNKFRARGRRTVDPDSVRDTGPSMLFNFILLSGILTLIAGVSGGLLAPPSSSGAKKKQT